MPCVLADPDAEAAWLAGDARLRRARPAARRARHARARQPRGQQGGRRGLRAAQRAGLSPGASLSPPRPTVSAMAPATLTDRAPELLRAPRRPGRRSSASTSSRRSRDLVDDRARVLCVQRTGWGKSAVYFLATALLRERGAGPDADRLAAAGADAQPDRGGRAARHPRAHDQLDQPRRLGRGARRCSAADAVDLLLISPERLNNPQFRDEMLPLFAERVGLLVVDEAHCISRLGPRLPARLPAHRATCSSALPDGRRRAGHDRDGERPRGRRRRRAAAARARGRAAHLPRPARRARRCASRSSSCPAQADRLAWLATHLPAAAGLGHRLHAHQARRRRWSPSG